MEFHGWAVLLGLAVLVPAAADDEPPPHTRTKPKDAEPFFQIWSGGGAGFMDASGRTVIEPQFAQEGFFFNGLASVQVGLRWGFIDRSGGIAIAPRFDAAGDFTGALAPVRVGRKWGYIDRSGRMVVLPTFQGAANFREGLARVELWDKIDCRRDGIFTKDDAPIGLFFIQPDISSGRSECFAIDSRQGYIGENGLSAIPPRFYEAHDFYEELAVVRVHPGDTWYIFIDREGGVAIRAQFDEAGHFSEGLAPVRVERATVNGIRDPGRCGYIDHLGKFVIRPQFATAREFSDGLAMVSYWDPERTGYGFIDKAGRSAFPDRWGYAEPFSEGLAEVSPWHRVFIDRQARVVISNVEPLGPFSGGLALVRDSVGELYIDKTGRPVARPTDAAGLSAPHRQ